MAVHPFDRSPTPAQLAAEADAIAMEGYRAELETLLLKMGRITGRNGLDACVAGILLRVQRALLGPAK
ncbi:MAG: hypothetical protein JWQ97_960 [Phenylobacterium sp.]|nr:hypothetical protein [Phenylobacterium sp.]